ncbi:E3 ubiquitin-protein ligase LNX isoform X3 [Lingula anatina]|uniref:E3 ubiquitin-protein ligase LNX isoform X3 n=1 Tax=Lingula anatina TaxID=7574 RepID=A0A1S3IGD5_LINAN|nr:E3 ubiquitin-protein ligase LNX isoform X3 [Lingula anatina]|eukprot:XP_013397282.1 E3 ubiquitin-protein ligase LNX isoform X3 [Lingula anatina]
MAAGKLHMSDYLDLEKPLFRSSSFPRVKQEATHCVHCGQFHDDQTAHLYDYHQAVDEDLICHICLQPLVNPMDTRCGHTFCSECIKHYLKIQKICPLDRLTLTSKDVQPASIMVKRLLDKLLVVCPNVDYCEEVLPRSELEAHLQNKCRGAVTRCLKSRAGCPFQGPRSALQCHMWECAYREEDENLMVPVIEGEVTTLDIPKGSYDLGISIVGGCDTPLMAVVIQEIFPEGVVAKDGRLAQGDQILEVNGEDLTLATHAQARQALKTLYPICRLTVYREKAEESQPIEKEEILRVTLSKKQGKQLGIKLVGKKSGPGLYILELIQGGLALQDGRLKPDDRILEINKTDMLVGTQEEAAKLIQSSKDKVTFVISRRTRPQTPDLIRSASKDCVAQAIAALEQEADKSVVRKQPKEKLVTITKDSSESLGISVAGGLGSQRGDVPIYVSNVQAGGCLARSKQVKKGDILVSINGISLMDLTHSESVKVLKACAESKAVSLKKFDGTETSDGALNFAPSWLFWLNLPSMCQTEKIISLEKSQSGSLGLAIVGGCDSSHGNQPIFVKSVVLNTPAAKDGRIRCGDTILSVNGQCLQNMTHAGAVGLLKSLKGTVTLTVVSWPGTVV